MKEINAYLMFDGKCAEAMTFYKKAFKAEVEMMPFSQLPPGHCPPGAENRIMHARLTKGGATLMASDGKPGETFKIGDNFTVSINCSSKAEVDEYANALKEGGQVTLPNQDMFWGAYFGMLTDKFGVQWMLNFDTPRK